MEEIWKDIKGYEGLYQVSSLGRIKSLDKEVNFVHGRRINKSKELKPLITTHGYCRVRLYKENHSKFFSIHRLVALNFIQNAKENKEVNHKNGIKTDNSVSNLEWVSSSENQYHAIKINLRKPFLGKHNPKNILSKTQVLDIRKQHPKLSYNKLAKKYNVSKSCIYSIIKRKNWKHI